jgi:TPR repeat protein
MRELGGRCLDGRGVPLNQEAGLALYRQAVDSGDTEAMWDLGRRYLDSDGVPGNQEEGLALYRQAVEGGDTEAMWELGVCYWRGRGVPVDRSRAGLYFWAGADRCDRYFGGVCGRELHGMAFAPI